MVLQINLIRWHMKCGVNRLVHISPMIAKLQKDMSVHTPPVTLYQVKTYVAHKSDTSYIVVLQKKCRLLRPHPTELTYIAGEKAMREPLINPDPFICWIITTQDICLLDSSRLTILIGTTHLWTLYIIDLMALGIIYQHTTLTSYTMSFLVTKKFQNWLYYSRANCD